MTVVSGFLAGVRSPRALAVAVLGGLVSAGAGADRYAARNGQTPAAPYATWETAASNIQSAVNAAANNDTVWVGSGRYTLPPNATNYPNASPNVVYINKPVSLRGATSVAADTIIDGQGVNRGIAWNYAAGSSTHTFIVDGITISNCFATNAGGGIFFNPGAWTGTVRNCVIRDNTVRSTSSALIARGGGIYGSVAAAWGICISNCVLRGNLATNTAGAGAGGGQYSTGGGMYLYCFAPGRKTIVDCLIEGNLASYGAGATLMNPPMTIANCTLRDNRAYQTAVVSDHGGGGLYVSGATALIRNCLIYGNTSSRGSGIFKMIGSTATGLLSVVNCTLATNYPGAAIQFRRNDGFALCNSIVFTNSILLPAAGPRSFSNSWIRSAYVTNGVNGAGNITDGTEPGFAGFPERDFRLTAASTCINAGTNQTWMSAAVDLNGDPRIHESIVDMGCYEYTPQGPVIRIK